MTHYDPVDQAVAQFVQVLNGIPTTPHRGYGRPAAPPDGPHDPGRRVPITVTVEIELADGTRRSSSTELATPTPEPTLIKAVLSTGAAALAQVGIHALTELEYIHHDPRTRCGDPACPACSPRR